MRWNAKEEGVEPVAGKGLAGFLALWVGAGVPMAILSFPHCSRRPNLCWPSRKTGVLGARLAVLGR